MEDEPVVPNVEASSSGTIEPRRSGRYHQVPERYGYLMEQDEVQIIDDDEPTTYKEMLSSVDKQRWLEAINSEMDSMYENQV